MQIKGVNKFAGSNPTPECVQRNKKRKNQKPELNEVFEKTSAEFCRKKNI